MEAAKWKSTNQWGAITVVYTLVLQDHAISIFLVWSVIVEYFCCHKRPPIFQFQAFPPDVEPARFRSAKITFMRSTTIGETRPGSPGRCWMGLTSGLCAGQSSPFTPNWGKSSSCCERRPTSPSCCHKDGRTQVFNIWVCANELQTWYIKTIYCI